MKIVVDHVSGSRRGQRQEFRSVTRLRFGRHPDNEVSFDAHRDLDASSRHAELRRKGRSYVLHDVGSSNGTFVDGSQSSEIALEKGTTRVVEFGAGGPRVRIWIGGLDDDPGPPPSEDARNFSDIVRAAARESGARGGGLTGAGAAARSFASEVFTRSSLRLRIAATLLLVLIVAGGVALFFWYASRGERQGGGAKAIQRLEIAFVTRGAARAPDPADLAAGEEGAIAGRMRENGGAGMRTVPRASRSRR